MAAWAGFAIASLSLFLFALSPVWVGIWRPGEITAVGLWALGCLATPFARAGGRPWILPIVVIVGLTMGAMPFLPIPLRSWLGAPEVGLGGAWFGALGLLAALFVSLELSIGAVVTAAGAVILLLVLLGPGWAGILNDWIAFIGFGVAATGSPLGYAVAVALVAASGSKGAIIIAVSLPLAWWWLRWPGNDPLARALLAVGYPLAITAAMFVIPWPSAYSRVLLWSAIGDAMQVDPWLLLAGAGWGSYNDLLLSVAVDPSWEGAGGGAFHSHSMYAEALSALGIPGLLAMLAVVAVPAWYCEDRRALCCWLGIAGLMAIWFPMPACVPFMAYALARCSRA